MNSPVDQITHSTPSDIECESILFTRYQSTLAVMLETGAARDALEAKAAWEQWLLVNQPDKTRRAAIPTPKLIRNILDREGKPS
jgi:hypothetical protein